LILLFDRETAEKNENPGACILKNKPLLSFLFERKIPKKYLCLIKYHHIADDF